MFSAQLNDDRKQFIDRDFRTIPDTNLPLSVRSGDVETDNVILLYNNETESFWMLDVKSFADGEYGNAEKMDDPGTFWEAMRKTYRSEQTGLVYRRIGARAYVYNMDAFKKSHPYTASEIILWDSEQLDHLLMKYDRETVEVSFAIQYLKYPQIEKLYKAGFEKIILDWVLRDKYTSKDMALFEKCFADEKTVNKITSLTKGQWSRLLDFRLTLKEWEWMRKILTSYRISDENVGPLTRMMIRGGNSFQRNFDRIVKCTENGEPAYGADQLIRDLINDHGHTGLSPHSACIYLGDYIRMCERNHITPVYRSENLRDEHDLMAAVQEEKKQQLSDEETQQIYDRRYQELEKYLFESDELIVLLPRRFADLITEGRNNHNCVGSLYVSRYQEGTSNIFFIREKTDPRKSYITVELNASCEKKVQAFYSHNRRITKKRDLTFIREWLSHNMKVNESLR